MNATNRLALLINDPSNINNKIMNHETSIQPKSQLTFPIQDSSHPSSILPSINAVTAPLVPRRDTSSLKHHRRRHQIDHTPKEQQQQQQTYQPLLNSSTLDDLFRALTLECEQYLAAASSFQNKTYGQMLAKPSAKIQATVESNDEDYENLYSIQTSIPPKPIVKTPSPLKTSIQVMSPLKRHVVSITVSSKVTSPMKSPSIVTKPIPTTITTVAIPTIVNRHSSEDDSINTSSSSTTRKHRRRRTRRQFPSSTGTRSSSSSNERKKSKTDRKSLVSKRSCSTDPRYQRVKTSYDNNFLSPTCSSQQQTIRRPVRRDISLQHPRSNSRSIQETYSSPLSVLLTSNKQTSDFLDNNNHNSHQQRQSRRSRLESLNHKSSTLLDRMQQQFYRPSPTRNSNNRNNIITHRIPSYPVY